MCRKKILKIEDYKNCLKPTVLENKINQLEKNKFDADSLRYTHKELIKNNKLILKLQPRFRSEKLCRNYVKYVLTEYNQHNQ